MHTKQESEQGFMDYVGIPLTEILQIDKLYTIHHFEYSHNFSFSKESHDFWEFIYVDNGSVKIYTDDTDIILRRGEVAFHKPEEFHKVETINSTAPNLVIISFASNSPIMDFFQGKALKIDERERTILSDIIFEAKQFFSSPLNDPYLKEMKKNEHIPPGTEQFIKIYMQQFLLRLYRRHAFLHSGTQTTSSRSSIEIFRRVCDYMGRNIQRHLTIEQICHENMIGRTQLQRIFQKESGDTVIEYFSKRKIDTAKYYIRSGKMNFTQISEKLGYTSVHYFSRQFKKLSGMTPSEYASSIKDINQTSSG